MAGKKNLSEDPYERLANAIVIQAADDYRIALKKISVPAGTASLHPLTGNT